MQLSIAGLAIAAQRFGSGGPRVLAVHGWLDNSASFAPLSRHLPGFDIVAVDLPGHGQSSWLPPSGEYHYVEWVSWLDRILDALGWETAGLLGHSMGAGICALYAGTFPDRVESLVLLDGLGPFTNAPATAPTNLAMALSARRRTEPREPRVYANFEEVVARKLTALPYLGEEAARLLVDRGTRLADDGVAFSHDPRLVGRSLLRFTEPMVLAFLEQIAAPTLIVRPEGGLDYPGEHGDGEARTKAIEGAELLRVEGHHHVHLTHPERIASAVKHHLRSGQ